MLERALYRLRIAEVRKRGGRSSASGPPPQP